MIALEHQTIGAYQLLQEIGRGGMAVVYRAIHPVFGDVAFKILPSYFMHHKDALKRFLQEAHAISTLQHPNIVAMFETGILPDPTTPNSQIHFIAMEYIPAGTLLDRMHRPKSGGQQQLIEVGIKIGSALDYAHSKGFIHRDIKPSNILFRPNGDPVLTDFGIAKGAGQTRLTQTGMITGTVAYMAPEVAAGQPSDGRADIYALGLILYEGLTGSHPFNDEDSSAVVLLNKVITTVLPPIRQLAPTIRPALAKVVERSISKSPADRPATAGAFVTELQKAQHSTGNTVSLRRPKVALNPASRKRRLALVGGGVATLALLVCVLLANGLRSSNATTISEERRLLQDASGGAPASRPTSTFALVATSTFAMAPTSTLLPTPTEVPPTSAVVRSPAATRTPVRPGAAPTKPAVRPTQPPVAQPPANNPPPVAQPPANNPPPVAQPPANNPPPVAQPPADRDYDGSPDATDRCPDQSGPTTNGGCPRLDAPPPPPPPPTNAPPPPPTNAPPPPPTNAPPPPPTNAPQPTKPPVVPPTAVPPTTKPPVVPPTTKPPVVPPTAVPPTAVPPTAVPPTEPPPPPTPTCEGGGVGGGVMPCTTE